MKKIFLLILITLSFSVFAQKADFDKAIKKLMYAKNGMLTTESITKDLARNIPQNKVAEFTKKMNVLKSNFEKTSIQEFKRKYSTADINEIYKEFTSDKINYSDKTNNFFKFFRSLKGRFYASAKQLYGEYQK
jgi:hypothetical protein